jgi:hypothetical protein
MILFECFRQAIDHAGSAGRLSAVARRPRLLRVGGVGLSDLGSPDVVCCGARLCQDRVEMSPDELGGERRTRSEAEAVGGLNLWSFGGSLPRRPSRGDFFSWLKLLIFFRKPNNQTSTQRAPLWGRGFKSPALSAAGTAGPIHTQEVEIKYKKPRPQGRGDRISGAFQRGPAIPQFIFRREIPGNIFFEVGARATREDSPQFMGANSSGQTLVPGTEKMSRNSGGGGVVSFGPTEDLR